MINFKSLSFRLPCPIYPYFYHINKTIYLSDFRTESGSNIILLVQLNSEKSLVQSCKANPQQLLIYEIGETFGGYWAAISKSMFQEESNRVRGTTFYTLKPTDPIEPIKDGYVFDNTYHLPLIIVSLATVSSPTRAIVPLEAKVHHVG